jgi:hypothetical protein
MTAQSPEIILIEGKEHDLHSLPLDPYLDASGRRPNLESAVETCTTALWRRYVGHWRITANALWLDRLTYWHYTADRIEPEREIDWNAVFPGQPQPAFASWFSGKLNIPMGSELMYVHMGWQSAYECERIIHVRRGEVTKTRDVDHRPRFLEYIRSNLDRVDDEGAFGPAGPSRVPPLQWLTEEGVALVGRELGLSPSTLGGSTD